MEKQRARTQEEKGFRRLKLIESAKKLFSEHGYQGTKINMITADAGLSPAAFYLYFKSKLHLYRSLSIIGATILTEMIEKALKSRGLSGEDKVRAVAGAYFSFFRDEREFYDIISVLHLGQTEFFTNQELVPHLEEQSLALLELLQTILDEGVSSGELKVDDTWKTSAVLWGMMDGVLLMEVKKATDYVKVDIETMTDHFLSLMLISLKN